MPTFPYDATFEGTFDTGGGHVLGRWTCEVSDRSDFTLQTYFDTATRRSTALDYARQTFDVDFKHRIEINDVNEVVWGLGYRWNGTHFERKPAFWMEHSRRQDTLLSGFIHDEIALNGDNLKLFVGTKIEHNESTGLEVQPSVRLFWKPTDDQEVWTAASRAVRTPSIANEDVRLPIAVMPGMPATVIVVMGSDDFDSEDLLAYELGYRCRPWDWLSLDVAAFFHDYDNLRSLRRRCHVHNRQ